MLSAKEIELGQTRYFILQYLRGDPKEHYSASSIAEDLELHHKTVAKHLRDMVAMGVLEEEYVGDSNHQRKLKIAAGWH